MYTRLKAFLTRILVRRKPKSYLERLQDNGYVTTNQGDK